MRRVAHGTCWFPDETRQQVLALMQHQSSAMRCAYQAIHKHGLNNNAIKIHVKKDYMALLNQRYIADAVSNAKQIKSDNALFGGKKSWSDMLSGLISKDEWQLRRNNQLYSRGDSNLQGNPNIRIQGDRILVNNPQKRNAWFVGKLFIPKKFKPELKCYDVRLIYRNDRLEVKIGWDDAQPIPVFDSSNGVIGIDLNPDGIAIVETDSNGNLLKHYYEQNTRIKYGSTNKRDSDIRELAKRVVGYAIASDKPIVMENLKFKQKDKGRKFNRMASNFPRLKMKEAIVSRTTRNDVVVKFVNPAFTSMLGLLKYRKMYSLNRHTAAALVIGRRGMNIKERQVFEATQKADRSKDEKNISWNLEGRDEVIALSHKAWSWLHGCFLKPKVALLTGAVLAAGLQPAIGMSAGGIPASESSCTTDKWRHSKECLG